MSQIKQTWRLIVKETGEVIVKSDHVLKPIKDKSLDLIEAKEDDKYRIQYFENDRFIGAEKLDVYF